MIYDDDVRLAPTPIAIGRSVVPVFFEEKKKLARAIQENEDMGQRMHLVHDACMNTETLGVREHHHHIPSDKSRARDVTVLVMIIFICLLVIISVA